jgi:hypothetical protein
MSTLTPDINIAATIGFAVAPCSLGFVIIAVSEHLIRSIMVGEDPEMLMSDLQNQFPHDAIRIIDNEDSELVSKVVDLIEHAEDRLSPVAWPRVHCRPGQGSESACLLES